MTESIRFEARAAPSAEKLRGGYYTPGPVARFLAAWASAAGPRILEPSCGDGAVLAALVDQARAAGRPGTAAGIVGVELDEAEAAKARRHGAAVVAADFFAWFAGGRRGSFDAVAGNPPYIRFGSWTEESRARAFALMRGAGLRPTRLTNAWVPFTVAAVEAVRPGGRVALVLPAELLQVGYAAQLREHLVDRLAQLTIVSFRRLVFDGVLQEVVLLLGERGQGPARVRTVEYGDAAELPPSGDVAQDSAFAPALRHDREKWTKYYLDVPRIDALRRVRVEGRLGVFADVALVDVGVVSGRNSFFCLTPSQVRERRLEHLCVSLVGRSAQLRGTLYEPADLEGQVAEDARCRLLAVPEGHPLASDPALRHYVAEGEAAGVHLGYKCSIRRSWWSVPSVWTPDAFMLRQIHSGPRVAANLAGATSTDTVHRVRLVGDATAPQLATALANSATFAFSEVMGRSYGGGILELEPREADALPLPDPREVPAGLVRAVDHLVRAGDLDGALDLVDAELLVRRLGMRGADVTLLRSVWRDLSRRRARRARTPRRNGARTPAG
ncbi:MAG TPA: class I SAM-dependent methyltransferase [Actinomycetes bacterium]|nr:class I SAM-dependent methyltransferase [Actinomycetes bacterium]